MLKIYLIIVDSGMNVKTNINSNCLMKAHTNNKIYKLTLLKNNYLHNFAIDACTKLLQCDKGANIHSNIVEQQFDNNNSNDNNFTDIVMKFKTR